MRLVVNVAVSQWRWSDPDPPVVLAGGRHELPNDDVALTAPFVRAIASAAAAGVVEVLEADAKAAKIIDGAVEADDDSLKVYEQAVASGAWLDGHLQNVIVESEHQLALLADQLADQNLDADAAAELVERVTFRERLHADAKARLAAHRGEA